jgi:hypothetical protein
MVDEADKLQEGLQDKEDEDLGYLDFDDNPDDTLNVDDEPPEDDFKHKYNVLKGKYDAEGSRSNEMLSKVMAENERLKLALGVPAQSTDDHFTGDASDMEITSFKKEYPSLAKGIEALTKKVISESVKDTHELIGQSRRETYVSKLDDTVADWRAINDDPEFIKWLQAKDKYTGATKHQLLTSAWNNFNLEASKAFFEDYKAEKGMTSSPRKSEDTFDLSPDTSGGTMPVKSQKGFISKDEISTFYRDRAMGKFTGSEADAEKIEAKIMRAVKEGKVR